ncbi:MAG: L-threonylcarbamoyladenylate synthase [Coriobacteriales bacterium]|jgi:tRNA threonylcarbamoyl adenosine modification protein (Sua5/YciO/YrdC/YwlC family)
MMETRADNFLRIDPLQLEHAVIERAVACLRAGGVVVFPTDTVYGIGVAAGEGLVPDELFEIKRRERSQTIPWLVRDARDIERYGRDVPDYCIRLAERLWPGALTLVVRCGDAVPDVFQGGDGTIALRAPGHEVPQALMRALDMPLATTSANLHGRPAVASAAELDPELTALVPIVLDGGVTPGGIPSTIVSCTEPEPRILRLGAISEEAIMECVS